MASVPPTARAASAGLMAIAGLHLVWATGSPWPAADRATLAEMMAGRRSGPVPGPAACLAVAGLLTSAAWLVSGHPRSAPRLSRAGSAGAGAVLATRGALGLAGRTDLLSPGSDSERFRDLDRRFYSPLCLALAAAAVPRRR